ncbi:Saccharopine dehydrogenase [Methanolacinia petrolearia DSM 11571]|uniref:Saccharopine dehydrogenase n=1 Tax=Methanolacinia petrolearia (strain DSM 11571 / OCM 486 / SEBR 4847) TaxID=679926 RepID=E1RJ97_METP4|nr:saccharopine dehydrogenase family protein [Methanolacinia petrolearia]ADN35615.1 Saccharopine dehydrogenase [Methanolacinia petrolearia DSM 11571]
MHKVLIIGAGGVGSVVVHKCAAQPDVFSEITLASRTCEKCIEIAESVRKRTGQKIRIEKVDADSVDELIGLISKTNPSIVINTALPYQDLTIMEACLRTGVSYLDTANYEPPEEAKFEYSWQWAYQEQFTEKGLTAILGCGFDPGVTNLFCAYARDKIFDTIEYIDIVDCNAGDHGHPFATNFNPEINIREITQKGKYWENGEWKYIEPLSESMIIDFPEVGEKKAYLLYHEEEESLVKNIPGLKRIRFWMTFSDEYLTHLRVLRNVGMTGIEPVEFEGHKIIPLKFLKELLPDPSSLSEGYTGKTSIGCIIEGLKDGKRIKKMIYNVCEHEKAHNEVGAQAVSYTTGVPAALGAEMFLRGIWNKPGVWNVEQFDPVPFLEKLGERGLPWKITDL